MPRTQLRDYRLCCLGLFVVFYVSFLEPAFASERTWLSIPSGLAPYLTFRTEVDTFTDERKCSIFVGLAGGPRLSIYDNQKIIIWPGKNKDFYPLKGGLIRSGNNKPIQMKYTDQEVGGLISISAKSRDIIRQLLKNNLLHIRYVSWPNGRTNEQTIMLWIFRRLYPYVARDCGWPQHEDLQIPDRKFKVVDHGKGLLVEKRVRIDGNPWIGIDVKYGSCGLGVISDRLSSLNQSVEEGGLLASFGDVKSVFTSKDGRFGYYENPLVDILGEPKFRIFDAEFKPVFNDLVSKQRDPQRVKDAARMALKMSPNGYLELRSVGGGLVPLDGFRALYEWAVENCGYPKIR